MIEDFEQYFDEVVALRRHFHQNPELGFKEYKTQEFKNPCVDMRVWIIHMK